MSRILLGACVLALAIRLYSQSPDCPWPDDGEPCPPGCYPAQLLGLEVVCYGIDDFHCCLEVWARYACTDKPNCLGQPCGGVARVPILTTSPAGFGECVNEMFCLRCSGYRYCGGNTIERNTTRPYNRFSTHSMWQERGHRCCTNPWRGRTRDSCTPASTHREGDLMWES